MKIVKLDAYDASKKEPQQVRLWKLLRSSRRATNPQTNAPLLSLGSDGERIAAAIEISRFFRDTANPTDENMPKEAGFEYALEDQAYKLLFEDLWAALCSTWISIGDPDLHSAMKEWKAVHMSMTADEWKKKCEAEKAADA